MIMIEIVISKITHKLLFMMIVLTMQFSVLLQYTYAVNGLSHFWIFIEI